MDAGVSDVVRCKGKLHDGKPCTREVIGGSEYCIFHHTDKQGELVKRFEKEFPVEVDNQREEHPDYFDFSGFVFPSPILFSIDMPETFFSECVFRKVCGFRKTELHEGIHFNSDISLSLGGNRLVFRGTAFFNEVTFERDAWFREVAFEKDAWFREVVFKEDAWFKEATFENNANFGKAAFLGYAGFNKVIFKLDANFGQVAFRRDTGFNKAVFGGDAGFIGAVFEGYSDFSEAILREYARFRGSIFKKYAGFNEVAFEGDAGFTGVIFKGYARFDEAVFKGNAGLKGTAFEGYAGFKGTAFEGYAGFTGAIFKEDTWFNEATFAIADFNLTSFLGETVFSGIHVNQASFINTSFSSHYHIKVDEWIKSQDQDTPSLLKIRRPRFMDAGKIIIEGSTGEQQDTLISGISLIDTELEKVEFNDNTWITNVYSGRKTVVDEILLDRNLSENVSYGDVAQLYRRLRKNFESAKRYEEAGDFFKGEMEVRRKHDPSTGIRILHSIYWMLADYGESLFLPLFWSILLITVTTRFLAINRNVALTQQIVTECLYEALQLFFPFKAPTSILGLAVHILGALLLTLLYTAINRKLERK